MKTPKFSIIVPAYNGARHLGETIESVLNQSYQNWELIVVNDASPDDTDRVVRQYSDERIIYIVNEQNCGADLSRQKGLEASTGDLIALLDQDDLFHPEKLEAHAQVYADLPDTGLTYNARFAINGSSSLIRDLWRPPKVVGLADVVLGYPFAPSDLVLRRDWALRPDIWEAPQLVRGEEVIVNGGEITFYGRMLMDGCKFVGIDRALNYRRYHATRVFSDLDKRCWAERKCQEIVLDDPRCPADVKKLRNVAHANIYLVYAYHAYVQSEVALARKLTMDATRSNPALLEGSPSQLVAAMLSYSVADERSDHATLLHAVFDHFPTELAWLVQEGLDAIPQGYLLKGSNIVMWELPEDAEFYFARAAELGARADETFVQQLGYKLLSYAREFGPERATAVVERLAPYLSRVATPADIRRLKGNYYINRAFEDYQLGVKKTVPGSVMRAIASDSSYATNRGAISILLRSLINVFPEQSR